MAEEITKTEAAAEAKELTVAPVTGTALTASPASGIWGTMVEKYGPIKAAEFLSQSTLIPEAYRGKGADCLIAIDFANRVGMAPTTVMQNLSIVKGKPSWSGQACFALAELSGKFSGLKHVYTGTKGTENRGCYVTGLRNDDGQRVDGTEVTIAMAKAEGWTSNRKWATMPEQMLAYRAAAFFARVHCPEVLLGLQTAEEIEDVDAARAPSRARSLTEALKGGAV